MSCREHVFFMRKMRKWGQKGSLFLKFIIIYSSLAARSIPWKRWKRWKRWNGFHRFHRFHHFHTPCISNPLDRPRWRPRWVKIAPRSLPLGNDCSSVPADILVISPLLESWSGDDPRSPWQSKNCSPLPSEIFPESPLAFFVFTGSLIQGV